MKKTFGRIEITECTYEYESVRQDGLYIHDLEDEFSNGDGVIGNACAMPETLEEAEDMLASEYCETDSSMLETVILKED